MSTTTVTAKQIQEDVLSAQEALLLEATAIIRSAKEEPAHCDSLKALGFTGAAAVLTSKQKAAKELADQADMYAYEYPGLKFIPTKAMLDVCTKYGLAVDHVSRYTGEVPAWALDQIARNKRHIPQKEVFDEEQYRAAMETEIKRLTAEGKSGWLYSESENWARGYGLDHDDCYTQWGGPHQRGENTFPSIHGMKKVLDLDIAAPVADMGIRQDEVVVDGQIVRVRAMDPIVCIPVKGGYIVLAAWGEEGQDPHVFNTENN